MPSPPAHSENAPGVTLLAGLAPADLERGTRGRWPAQLEALALAIYAETGSVTTASRETGIPQTTIYQWANEDEECIALIDNLRVSVRANYAHKLAGLIGLGLARVHDALTLGDEYVDRFGNLRHKRMSGKDAAFVTSILIDKHALVTGALVGAKASATLHGLADKLSGLMAQAQRLNGPPEVEANDGPLVG